MTSKEYQREKYIHIRKGIVTFRIYIQRASMRHCRELKRGVSLLKISLPQHLPWDTAQNPESRKD